jgi:hypothetical protein
MYIDPNEIKGTKFIVNKKDCNAVQKVLFNCGYGYLQGLSLNINLRKYNSTTAFYVNYAGEIETVSIDEYDDEVDFYTDFRAQPEGEISWTALF